MEDNKDIDFLRIFGVLLKRWYLILGAAVLCAAFALAYTIFMITPMYRATVQVYVSNKVDYNTNQEEVALTDVYTSRALVPIYSTMVRTNMVLEKVANSEELAKAGIHYNAAQLASMLSTEQYEKTAVLRLTVVNPNKEYCHVIANAIATTGVNEITNVNPGSTANIIDEAEMPNKPFSPSKVRNTIFGFIMGLIFMSGILIMRDIFDVKIKDEDALSGIIGAPVLGRISNFTSK